MKAKQLIASFLMLAAGAQLCLAQTENLPIAEGKFKPTDESLEQYEYPEWFQDAKFGIWSHWGPQAVPRQGDWYARKLYVENNYNRRTMVYTGKPDPVYTYHKEHYGHPSEFGYKDIIPMWKAERFDPEALMKLYKEVGAKYFVSMGVHHDNFFLWNSKLHPKWNSVNMGPKRDIVGEWQAAARKEGLKFGVSEHLGASYTWYQTAKGADKEGPMAGVPYDGANPEYFDLYHGVADPDDTDWYTTNPVWQREWYDRIVELIDMYKPDLLYTDGEIPFNNEVGRSMIAHYYNRDLEHNKKSTVVYNCKEESNGRFVHDLERGIVDGIREYPWQTDTSIGNWFYKSTQGYISATELTQMLIDIVSKNGNLLINIVQTPEGDLEQDVLDILKEFGAWMKINGEAIYATRPWINFGEGPSLSKSQGKGHKEGIKDVRAYEAGDLRFTKKGKTIYAFAMEHPVEDICIKSMPASQKVKSVKMLGSKEKIKFSRGTNGELIIAKPANMPDYRVVVFEIK